MSTTNNTSAKRSHRKTDFTFPDDLEIPEPALNDRKFLSSYVHIYNDPRVYKRRRLNGDRTSSRFDVDQNYQVKVVFNEPIVQRKSILSKSTQSANDDSVGARKSVSFSSKIVIIDSIDLDGVSSDWTDVESDEKPEKSKTKSKKPKNGKVENKSRKKATTAAAANDKPSSKSKKKTKDKSSSAAANKNGHKAKSAQKELFKFKITKPFRKFGRSKDKKLKHLQKKFGRRMFKAFVQVKRSFNLKTLPDKVTVPLEKITLKTDDVTATAATTTTTPVKSVPSIQDFLIGQMTKKVKVSLAKPVNGNQAEDTVEPMVIGEPEIMQSNAIESNSLEANEHSSRTENGKVESDNSVEKKNAEENAETYQNVELPTPIETINSGQLDQLDENGDATEIVQDCMPAIPAETTDSTDDLKILPCNDTEPSPEAVVESNGPLPNLIDKITCSMYYNTNKDETVTMEPNADEVDDGHDMDLVENISIFNFSFSMPTSKSLADNMLGCDSPEIASIQLQLND